MRNILKASAIALLGLALLAPMASAAPRYGVGFAVHPRVIIRGGFGYPAFGVWYDPYWGPYYPYWDPAYVYSAPTTGDLKIKTPVRDASVYIDGGFAGVTGKVKDVPLTPGVHSVELRAPDGTTIFQQDVVTVAAGRTTEVDA